MLAVSSLLALKMLLKLTTPAEQEFKGILSTPFDSEHYTIKRWASNAERNAAYVVFPTDAQDISLAILV